MEENPPGITSNSQSSRATNHCRLGKYMGEVFLRTCSIPTHFSRHPLLTPWPEKVWCTRWTFDLTWYSCSYLLILKRLAILKIQKGKTALLIPEHISGDLNLAALLKEMPAVVWEGSFFLLLPNFFKMQGTGMEVLFLYMERTLKDHLTDWMLEKNPKSTEA